MCVPVFEGSLTAVWRMELGGRPGEIKGYQLDYRQWFRERTES